MSAETMVTEREAILREREAVRRAVAAVWQSGRTGASLGQDWCGSDALAVRLYPLPTVTRPRVVTIHTSSGKFRAAIIGGKLCDAGSVNLMPVHNINVVDFGVDGLRAVAHLLANPTEEVPE